MVNVKVSLHEWEKKETKVKIGMCSLPSVFKIKTYNSAQKTKQFIALFNKKKKKSLVAFTEKL